MGAQSHKPRDGEPALTTLSGTIEGLQLPIERVLVNVGMLLNDTQGFPTQAMERLDTIHREAAKLYETITRLTLASTVEEVESR